MFAEAVIHVAVEARRADGFPLSRE